jgi:hypothetical protein
MALSRGLEIPPFSLPPPLFFVSTPISAGSFGETLIEDGGLDEEEYGGEGVVVEEASEEEVDGFFGSWRTEEES